MDGFNAHAAAKAGYLLHDNPNALIVSTYFKGVTSGQNLGTAGYSYEFVRQLFLPLMRRWGEVVFVKDAKTEVEQVGRRLRSRNLRPIHVGFVACQDMYFSPTMPNVVVPAWEFPDVPNIPFEGNPQNDWVATSNRCDMVLAHVPFTVNALVRAGVTTPVHEVPVPMPAAYFQAPLHQPDQCTELAVPGCIFSGLDAADELVAAAPPSETKRSWLRLLRSGTRHALRAGKRAVKMITPKVIVSTMHLVKYQWRLSKAIANTVFPWEESIPLSGVVYTSILNPVDSRKNWMDLITGFVWAMKDCEDATLVIKSVTPQEESLAQIVAFYRRIPLPHKCRVVLIRDYLNDEQMMDLLRASSYYVTTTKAEGNCLPLMNYLAAGRPGISPAHSAIADYFSDEVGFVAESHCEPSIWPQETTYKIRTTWARLVWPSFVEQMRRSYHVAKHDRRTYERLAMNGRSRMRAWLAEENVYPLLRDALDQVARAEQSRHGDASRRAA